MSASNIIDFATIQRQASRRVRSEDVIVFATEFDELLRDSESCALDDATAARLEALQQSFEELARDMREASVNIRRLLSRP